MNSNSDLSFGRAGHLYVLIKSDVAVRFTVLVESDGSHSGQRGLVCEAALQSGLYPLGGEMVITETRASVSEPQIWPSAILSISSSLEWRY